MNAITRDVKDIDPADRRAIEHVLGQPLEEGQRVVINVLGSESSNAPPSTNEAEIPSWLKIYEGLDPAEVDRLDQAIRQRSQSTRNL